MLINMQKKTRADGGFIAVGRSMIRLVSAERIYYSVRKIEKIYRQDSLML